jgi:hypothetical protein
MIFLAFRKHSTTIPAGSSGLVDAISESNVHTNLLLSTWGIYLVPSKVSGERKILGNSKGN